MRCKTRKTGPIVVVVMARLLKKVFRILFTLMLVKGYMTCCNEFKAVSTMYVLNTLGIAIKGKDRNQEKEVKKKEKEN